MEQQLSASPEKPAERELAGNIAAIRSFFAMLAGEYAAALDLGQRAETLLSERSVQARSLLPYTIGSAYRGQGEYEKAVEAFALVTRIGEKNHNLMVWGTGVTELVNMHRSQGRLRQAEETGRQALQKMVDQGVYPFGSLAKIEVALSEVLREQNELDEARQRVTGVIARMQDWNMPTDRIFASLALIHILEAQEDFDGAFEELRIAKNLKAANPVLLALAKGIDYSEIRLHLATGNLSAASRLGDELHPNANRVVSLREQELALLARLRLAQGRPDEAVNILEPFVQDGLGPHASGHLSILLEIMALQVRALDVQGSHEAALELLLKALALAEPEGFVRVFVDQGAHMGLLIADCRLRIEDRRMSLDEGLRAQLLSYTTRLLAAFPASPPLTTTRTPLPALLTERELEVLRLIAEGLKYEEIAGRLFISLNTVRTYVKGIYGKLDVNNRTRAIALARELKLI